MKDKKKKILIGAGIVAVGTAVTATISYCITRYLVGVALNRQETKLIKKMKSKFLGPYEQSDLFRSVKIAANELRNKEHLVTSVTADDGTLLIGHYFQCPDEKRIILAMHGWRSTWADDFAAINGFWQAENCSILYVEQRGQNNSEGEYMGFGLIERFDCQKWIDWLVANTSPDIPIYLAGISMGASSVLMAAGKMLNGRVHGVLSDCGFTSPYDIWKHVVEDDLHLSYSIRGKVASDICKRKINIGSNDYSTLEAMKTNKVPVLFIHGTDDSFVPIKMTYENYKVCKAPKRLFVVPGADHGMSYVVDEDGYKNSVRSFWREFDQV